MHLGYAGRGETWSASYSHVLYAGTSMTGCWSWATRQLCLRTEHSFSAGKRLGTGRAAQTLCLCVLMPVAEDPSISLGCSVCLPPFALACAAILELHMDLAC
jgi:hypothetical protein